MQVESTDLTPLMDLEKAPKRLFDVELTPAQQTDYCLGKEIFLKDMNIGGQSKDGKVKLYKDAKGDLLHKMDYRKENLEIPKSIFDKVLSEEEVKKLHKGEDLELNTKNGKYFVKIDKELNSVVVRSEKEISSMPQIGEYKLSSQEQKDLLDGKRMETKVFKGKDGYFTANVELSKDKKGLVFSNAKPVSDIDAKMLIDRYNKPKEFDNTTEILSASSVASVGKEAIKEQETTLKSKSMEKKTEPDFNIAMNHDYFKNEHGFESIKRYEGTIGKDDSGKDIKEAIYVGTDKSGNKYTATDLTYDMREENPLKNETLSGPSYFDPIESNIEQKIASMELKDTYIFAENSSEKFIENNFTSISLYSVIEPSFSELETTNGIYIATDKNNNFYKSYDKALDFQIEGAEGPTYWKKTTSYDVDLIKSTGKLEDYKIPGNTSEKMNEKYSQKEVGKSNSPKVQPAKDQGMSM